MVSRGSSMLIEGIDELKGMTGKWESAICVLCGPTAGLLLGLASSMWKESVAINRISLFGVPWLMLVLVCMMRWIYAPHQRGYLYFAMFCFGICATIHQTLMVAAMGIEIGVAVCQPRLGRDLFTANSIVYLLGLMGRGAHLIPAFESVNPMVFAIFNFVGLGSLVTAVWLIIKTGGLFSEWKSVLLMGLLWVAGAAFYFYEPLAGMTNPPMEWGYPRTVQGFFHALSRGQYGKIDPTDIFHDPSRFGIQLPVFGHRAGRRLQLGLHVLRGSPVSLHPKNAEARTFLDHRRGRNLPVSRRAADDLSQPFPRAPNRRFAQSFLHRLAFARRHHDRLRDGPDSRVHGGAIPKV